MRSGELPAVLKSENLKAVVIARLMEVSDGVPDANRLGLAPVCRNYTDADRDRSACALPQNGSPVRRIWQQLQLEGRNPTRARAQADSDVCRGIFRNQEAAI